MESTILGAVLAGGSSRRMGRDKASLEWRGRPLAVRAAEELRKALGEAVVVGREAGDAAAGAFRALPDGRPGAGPLAGIESALRLAAGRDVFVLACDLPRVEAPLVRWIVAAAAAGAPETLVWYPTLGEDRQPLCALWRAGALAAIERRLDAGRRGVLELLDALPTAALALGPELELYRDDLLWNVNRPRDLGAVAAARGGES